MNANSRPFCYLSRLFLLMPLFLTLNFFAPTVALAEPKDALSVEQAKEYLLDYRGYKTNAEGKLVYMYFEFDSDEKLMQAAQLLSNMGTDEFHAFVETESARIASEQAPDTELPSLMRSASPAIIRKTVSGNGAHRVYGEAHGTCNFGKDGNVLYTVNLGLTVTVKNGGIISANNPTISFPYVSAGGRVADGISLPTGCNPNESASVTANFSIERVINFPIGDLVLGTRAEAVPMIVTKG